MRALRINEKWLGLALVAAGGVWLMVGGLNGAWWASPPLVRLDSESLTPSQPMYPRIACRALKVYDGDTLGCDLNANGHIERPGEVVRLLGIDSPEMHYSRKNLTFRTTAPRDEPFALPASRWLTKRAEGGTVFLEFDRRETDRYGRRLAYVYAAKTDERSINEEALAAGIAKTLFLGRNRRYQSRFEEVEDRARQAAKGLWTVVSP
jgi:endonuclease YncB( thermonuclease family)